MQSLLFAICSSGFGLAVPALTFVGPTTMAATKVVKRGKITTPKKKRDILPIDAVPTSAAPLNENLTRAAVFQLPAGINTPPLPENYRAVALLPLTVLNVGEDVARHVEYEMLGEIDEFPKTKAVSPQDVLADLRGFGLDLAACNGDGECLAKLARLARVHLAVEVQLVSVGGTVSLSLRLLDAQKGIQINAVADTVSDDERNRADEIHRLAVQLLAPETYVGSLTLLVPEAGTDVYVDDKLVGMTPLPGPLEKLRAGPHILHLSKSGFSDLYQFVDVTFVRNTVVTADLRNATVSGAIGTIESKTGLGSLFVSSVYPGIEIRIDGEPRGTTPWTTPIEKIPVGSHRVTFRAGGVSTEVREIKIEATCRTDIVVTKTAGALEIGTITVVSAAAPLPLPGTPLLIGSARGPGPQLGLWERLRQPTWRARAAIFTGASGGLSLLASGIFADQVRRTSARRDAILNEAKTSTYERWQVLDKELQKEVNPSGARAEMWQWITLGAGAVLSGTGASLLLTALGGN